MLPGDLVTQMRKVYPLFTLKHSNPSPDTWTTVHKRRGKIKVVTITITDRANNGQTCEVHQTFDSIAALAAYAKGL